MVQRHTVNEEISIQENLLKFGKNNKSVVFESKPLPPPSQLSETSLQTGVAKSIWLPPPHIFMRGSEHPHFSSWPYLYIAETKFYVSMTKS